MEEPIPTGEGRRGLAELTLVGHDFARPECVLATRRGELFASDRRGGVRWLDEKGISRLIGGSDIVPNGIAMTQERSFIAANLAGPGVWKISRDGRVEPHIETVDGVTLPGVNFVCLDDQGRLWITVSTLNPEAGQYSRDSRDGFIALSDRKGIRIVADGLCWTNECRVSPDGAHLYVNETFARRLTRFRIAADGALTDRATVTEFGVGVYPDGLALDQAGNVWIVSIVSNRVIRVAPDGRQTIVIRDEDPAQVAELEELHRQNKLTRPALGRCRGSILSNISSIAFGGPDLRTAFLGSLGGDSIASFRVSVPGVSPPHWAW